MSILNLLINASVVFGFGYVAITFLSTFVVRRPASRPAGAVSVQQPVQQDVPVPAPALPDLAPAPVGRVVPAAFCCDADPTDAAIVDAYMAQRRTVVDNVVPFRRPASRQMLGLLTIRELKRLASQAKIKGYSSMTKRELIVRLVEARAA